MVKKLIIKIFILQFVNVVVQFIELVQTDHDHLRFDFDGNHLLGNILFMTDLVLYYLTVIFIFYVLFRFKRVEVALNPGIRSRIDMAKYLNR